MKKLLFLIPMLLGLLFFAWCSDADMASYNLSKDADYFRVNRRIIFYNGITNDYMLSIEGFCSLGNDDKPWQLTVTCKTWEEYKKHFLGLSDNVTYIVEQLESANVSTNHYKVVFKPQTIIPDVEVKLQ